MQVLIVDDDKSIVDVIDKNIEWLKIGITQVFSAYNIEQAKEVLRNNSINIVISDIEMPQGSGLDLLSWIREQNLDAEFILLTCHEKFDYATNAMKLRAAEYMLKPFDPVVMGQALRKLVLQINENRIEREERAYGKWAKNNQRQIQMDFLNMLLDGRIPSNRSSIQKEMEERNITIDEEDNYVLIISKVTDIEKDLQRMTPNLLKFIIENMHSEILCGTPESIAVTRFDYKDYYIYVTACKETDEKRLEKLCDTLLIECKKVLFSTTTCCISRTCKLEEFYSVFQEDLNLFSSNISYYGNFFQEKQMEIPKEESKVVLDIQIMENYLLNKSKMEFMSYLKQRLNDTIRDKSLNEQMLIQVKQEILQVIYTYLAKMEIQASGLFSDKVCVVMTQKATQSIIDMLRWVNYILDRTFEYEDEVKKGYSIIEKINVFIREHYTENIGRNEIAAQFYLTPEYLSKMYKKQTGQNLKDYINEYRIEQAKVFLKKEDMTVSDVAKEVGFDNFTYFSTTFKKYTGITPYQFKKSSS